MSPTETYYITTAIDYVNAKPHLGHAYEKIAADVMARFQRLQDKSVFFLTGTDEHGTKVQKTAQKLSLEPKAYTDEIAQAFQEAWAQLNISYNRFIRTTDEAHYQVVEYLWRVMKYKDDIYKASYVGKYCSGCELFLSDRDLNDEGQCAIHQTPPDMVEEENYFFRLTAYRDKLKAHIEANPEFVQPDFRRQEVLRMLDDVQDISVSRNKQAVSWGIPVPDDPEQTIYVWIDALSNYLTGIGFQTDEGQYKTFWPAQAHVIGKDILRFHAIYWPAMLMAAEVPLPQTVFAHGFITINDAKISKSLGNVVAPVDLINEFNLTNPDPIRYYLMTTTTFGNDGNFSVNDFKLRVNADLANNLGNLLNRSLNMTKKYFESAVPAPATPVGELPLVQQGRQALAEARELYGEFRFLPALEKVIEAADGANRLINDAEPWTLHKNGELDKLADVMYSVLETLRMVAVAISPVTPTLASGIWLQLGCPDSFEEVRWSAIEGQTLAAGQAINIQGPLLPRLDDDIVGAGGKKKG